MNWIWGNSATRAHEMSEDSSQLAWWVGWYGRTEEEDRTRLLLYVEMAKCRRNWTGRVLLVFLSGRLDGCHSVRQWQIKDTLLKSVLRQVKLFHWHIIYSLSSGN